MTTQATPRQIRAYLGHGQGSRKVRITIEGRVNYYGSTDPANRQHDYWHEGRFADEYRVADDGTVYAA